MCGMDGTVRAKMRLPKGKTGRRAAMGTHQAKATCESLIEKLHIAFFGNSRH